MDGCSGSGIQDCGWAGGGGGVFYCDILVGYVKNFLCDQHSFELYSVFYWESEEFLGGEIYENLEDVVFRLV